MVSLGEEVRERQIFFPILHLDMNMPQPSADYLLLYFLFCFVLLFLWYAADTGYQCGRWLQKADVFPERTQLAQNLGVRAALL